MRKLTDDSPTDTPTIDPRNLGPALVGTPTRDAAVDPKPEDFLEPTNAGKANPHGPEVVNPELHASQGVRPVKPGPVGEADVQDVKEPEHAEKLQTGATTDQPAGNASRSEWLAYVLERGEYNPGSVEDFTRDELRDLYKD